MRVRGLGGIKRETIGTLRWRLGMRSECVEQTRLVDDAFLVGTDLDTPDGNPSRHYASGHDHGTNDDRRRRKRVP